MACIGYARISSDGQSDNTSIANQRDRIAAFAVNCGESDIKRLAGRCEMHFERSCFFRFFDDCAKKPFCILADACPLIAVKKAMTI